MADINNEYDIVAAFERIEKELIESMMRNLDHHRAEEDELGINWSQWQVEQLRALEEYKKRNAAKYGTQFKSINKTIDSLIKVYRKEGNTSQEVKILQAIKEGFKCKKQSGHIIGEFIKLNDRKIDALINATKHDFEKAEIAMLRRANDQYRKIIYSAHIYANTGGTYEKAVDMATKDFLQAGINCIEYKNGSRHTMKDYADMALKTAGKRAYLTGEGEKRKEWGIATVIMNKRGNPCPKCYPWVGKILIDDVWSGGSKDGKSSVTGVKYPLMSNAIAAGLYHPRCKDSHTTYFEGINTPPDGTYTKDELNKMAEDYQGEQKEKYAKNQAVKYDRLAKYSLDKDNKEMYKSRADAWKKTLNSMDTNAHDNSGIVRYNDRKNIEKRNDSDIINLTDDEQHALNQYFSFESYGLNEKLRKNIKCTQAEKKMIKDLDSALGKMPKYEGNLSRSLYFDDEEKLKECVENFKEGSKISFKEYISTRNMIGLHNPDGQVQIFIQNSKKGRNLSRINISESEVLYERNSQFNVLNVIKRDNKYYILLEEA